jgi:hypothetical protein
MHNAIYLEKSSLHSRVHKLISDSHHCYIITLIQIITEYLSWFFINPASFTGGPSFKSPSKDQLHYSNWCFLSCYTFPPSKCWGFTLKQATPFPSISFPICCSCVHPTSEYYIRNLCHWNIITEHPRKKQINQLAVSYRSTAYYATVWQYSVITIIWHYSTARHITDIKVR